jgi:hypothetical protein
MTVVSTSTIKYSDISASYVKPNILGQTLLLVLVPSNIQTFQPAMWNQIF